MTKRTFSMPLKIAAVTLATKRNMRHLFIGLVLTTIWTTAANARPVSIHLKQLTAIKTTEYASGFNDRDEVYMDVYQRFGRIVSGQDEINETRILRLPRYESNDDYYEFKDKWARFSRDPFKWTNQDQKPVGNPIFWNGDLPTNSYAEILVLVAEQENKTWGRFRIKLEKALDEAIKLFPKDKASEYKIYVEASKVLVGLLPDKIKDDVIGMFYVRVENVNGQLKTITVVPGKIERPNGGWGSVTNKTGKLVDVDLASGSRKYLNLKVHSRGQYDAIVEVSSYRKKKNIQRYLSKHVDKCSKDWIRIPVVNNRNVGVRKDVQTEANIPTIKSPSTRFYWYCGGNGRSGGAKETATCKAGTDFVRVSRGKSGRKIDWACFATENYYAFPTDIVVMREKDLSWLIPTTSLILN